MTSPPNPEQVFICGAVGSGNTFMFNCLTQDKSNYGVNEDALGSTLFRLVESEREMGKCPHSVESFVQFIRALRGDRRTLVLKTPSNLRYSRLLSEHLPSSVFIKMLREPHAAIASGVERHDSTASIIENAKRWQRDCQEIIQMSGGILITFEELVRDPVAALRRVDQAVLPVSQDVYQYGERMHRPDRSDPDRWRNKVGPEVAQEIERCVVDLELQRQHQDAIAAHQGEDHTPHLSAHSGATSSSALKNLRTQFYRLRYRLFK